MTKIVLLELLVNYILVSAFCKSNRIGYVTLVLKYIYRVCKCSVLDVWIYMPT